MGIVSIALFGVGVLSFLSMFAGAMNMSHSGNMSYVTGLQGLAILMWIAIIAGVVLGIVGLIQRRSSHLPCVIGLILNGGALLLLVITMLNAAAARSAGQ